MRAKKPRRSSTKMRYKIILYTFLLALLSLGVTKYLEIRVMPIVIKTMEAYCTAKATGIIDKSVISALENMGIESSDLYEETINENGKLTSLAANTVLINNLCSQVVDEVLVRLAEFEDDSVDLPLGILTGFDFLAEKGPEVFKINVRPVGQCTVDYGTHFESAGINQINFQIWLEVDTKISVVNPLTNQVISVSRNIPVVNAYINGDVPESMFFPLQSNFM